MTKLVINYIHRNSGENEEQYKARKTEIIAKLVKKFRKIVDKAGIIKEIQEKQFYQKPSEVRRLAKKKGIRNWKRMEKKLNDTIDYRDKR